MIILAALALALVAWATVAFNTLVRLRNQVRAGWSDIDVQLMRRHDLVPALVEAVRAYASHEKGLFEDVAALRARAVATASPMQLAGIEAQLEQGVARLLAVKEAYPELKAGENFLELQRDLVDVEDHLQYARRFYNGAVRGLNDGVQSFPANLVAGALGFQPAEFFEAGVAARVAPSAAPVP